MTTSLLASGCIMDNDKPIETVAYAKSIVASVNVDAVYYPGDTLKSKDVTVQIQMSDGTLNPIPSGWAFSEQPLEEGINTINVSYSGLSTTFTVITKRNDYLEKLQLDGEAIIQNGDVIRVDLNNDDEPDVINIDLSPKKENNLEFSSFLINNTDYTKALSNILEPSKKHAAKLVKSNPTKDIVDIWINEVTTSGSNLHMLRYDNGKLVHMGKLASEHANAFDDIEIVDENTMLYIIKSDLIKDLELKAEYYIENNTLKQRRDVMMKANFNVIKTLSKNVMAWDNENNQVFLTAGTRIAIMSTDQKTKLCFSTDAYKDLYMEMLYGGTRIKTGFENAYIDELFEEDKSENGSEETTSSEE